ncbi:polymerase [Peptoniphilus porci]|uniref:Polymerase n=1 Tax=Peptoniphilus porci TaxID=2652280 RepID=A0A1U7LYF6_9FIRM|nr:polymerase [Peptoniphilus porci]
MVVKSKKINFILLSALFLTIIYYFLGTKFFLAAFIGISGLLLVIYDIKIGLFASAFLYPFVPDALGLIMLLSMGFFVLLRAALYKEKFTVGARTVPIAIFAFIIVFSTITSIDPSGSIRDLALNAAGISFLFAMTNSIKTKGELNAFISTLLLSALVVALLGVMQYFTGVEMRPEWLDTENNTDIAVRVYSVFFNPNILAEYLVLITPIAVGITWHTKSMKKKFLFAASTGILLICIVMTLSRGGWVGIALAALAFVLLVDRRLLLLGVPIILGGLAVLPQKVVDRITSIGSTVDTSNLYRIKIWQITKEVIRDNLVAGVGFGYMPFKETFEKYIRTMPIYHAHNTYLEIAAEIGIVGFIFFMLLLLATLKYDYTNLVKSEDKYFKYLGAGLFASIIGIMGHGLVEHFLYIPRIIFTFWIVLGIIFTAIKIEKIEREKEFTEKSTETIEENKTEREAITE